MKLTDFCNKYDVSINSIYVGKSTGAIPKEWFYDVSEIGFDKKKYKVTYIKSKKIIDRYNFKFKIINLAHANYYFLTKTLNASDISEALYLYDNSIKIGSWNSFISMALFSLDSRGVLNNKVSMNTWKFYKITTHIINTMFRIKNVKRENRDLERIWL